MNMNDAIQLVQKNVEILEQNITKLGQFDYKPFDEKDADEIKKHLDFVAGLCRAYIQSAYHESFDK